MTRTPIDIYRGLIDATIPAEIASHIDSVISRYSDQVFAGQKLTVHLSHFIETICKTITTLDGRTSSNISDLTGAVDVLDYFTSTSKWWTMNREDPGFQLRPPSRDPREFMLSLSQVQVGGDTSGRIAGAAEKLARFLEDHGLTDTKSCETLCERFVSCWVLLSGFSCKSQGHNMTTEGDFETAYDILRILLFYTPLDDFKALTAIRRIATNPKIAKVADIAFSPGFERKLESSMAARLERSNETSLVKIATSLPSASRNLLTNSLKFLAQIKALELGVTRIEENDYDSIILGSMSLLETIGISQENFRDEATANALFRKLQLETGVDDKLSLIIRRLEGLLVDSTGSREFLLQNAKLVPRMVALLLLLAGVMKDPSEKGLQDLDFKRSLILFHKLING
ncbi:MAG: hypothetical protein EAX95_00745 [Candidatus Thorarchaeota archaeon]|nr:hypothetical protein [Candidatus Thorarchaeota archaeon]